MRHIVSVRSIFPYKSVAVALVFTIFLGPIGLLYASCWGGIVMIGLGLIVIRGKLIFSMILVWLISVIWGVWAVEYYNKKQLNQLIQRS